MCVSLTLCDACLCVCRAADGCNIQYEVCEQAVCAGSHTARLVRTNEVSVCEMPLCWPLLCSLLP